MLSELYIRNFAIIEELRLHIAAGFNVLTGETGAGKSIILDAVMLVLGGRGDTTMVRAGCQEAYVEAVFALSPGLQTALAPVLLAEGLEEDGGETVLLARELRLNGRHICRVNGRSVSLNVLRLVAEPLIDIHGQGEHLSLLKPRSHLPLLDSYANVEKERTAVSQEVSRLYKIQQELKELRQNERTMNQRIDMLQFQIQEIGAANLKPSEEEELREERTRLTNMEHLTQHGGEALKLLKGVGEDSLSILDNLGKVERALTHLVRFDPTQNEKLERLQGLNYQLGDMAGELQEYLESLEFSPTRLNHLEERLELIHRLKRKYGDDISAVLATREKAMAELDKISHSDERIAELEKEQEQHLRRIGHLAQELSQKRRAAGQKLSQAVERELADLSMAGARFAVDFQHTPQADGVFVGENRLAFDQTGIDRAEFLISTNPGEPMKPMAKVASGGETARLMLAMKTALAKVDATPTLIFDEIDQGIGGRVGDIVGRKLWGLTAVSQHQVIVVTHLPQLAGYGDAHFHVSKQVANGRTITAVQQLDQNGRIIELAAMLGTQGDHARGGAAAILQQAAAVKRGG